MRYSVLLTSQGPGPQTLATLEAVRQQIDAGPGQGELILVLAHPRGSLTAAEQTEVDCWVDRVHFDNQHNKARALNSAVLAARGDWLVFTESGAIPEADWLAQLLEPLLEGQAELAGSAGPVLPIFPNGAAPGWLQALMHQMPSHALGPLHGMPPGQTEYGFGNGLAPLPFGTNLALSREHCREVGFDEDLLPMAGVGMRTGEDTQLVLSLLLRGHRILHLAQARVCIPVPPRKFALAYAKAVCQTDGSRRGKALFHEGPWSLERMQSMRSPLNLSTSPMQWSNRSTLQLLHQVTWDALIGQYTD